MQGGSRAGPAALPLLARWRACAGRFRGFLVGCKTFPVVDQKACLLKNTARLLRGQAVRRTSAIIAVVSTRAARAKPPCGSASSIMGIPARQQAVRTYFTPNDQVLCVLPTTVQAHLAAQHNLLAMMYRAWAGSPHLPASVVTPV